MVKDYKVYLQEAKDYITEHPVRTAMYASEYIPRYGPAFTAVNQGYAVYADEKTVKDVAVDAAVSGASYAVLCSAGPALGRVFKARFAAKVQQAVAMLSTAGVKWHIIEKSK